MNAERLRRFCLSLPQAAEDIKWEDHLCFLIAKKMFAVAKLEPTPDHFVAFKTTPEKAAELIEMEGIVPTPYMARNHWVTLTRGNLMRDEEIEGLIRGSYELIVAKLPKRIQTQLLGGPEATSAKKKTAKKKAVKKKPAKRKH